MSPEQILKAADHAANQGVVWFLSIALICLVLALIILVRWMFAEYLKAQKRADETTAAHITHLENANKELVATVARNNDLFAGVQKTMLRLDDHLRGRDSRDED